MIHTKVLEATASGDWQTLKLLFEKPKAPFIMEGAITPDDDLLNEWWGKIWPQYEDEGYTKDEIRGYILSGNWDADHLRNDIKEHDAKYDDGPGIVLADSLGEAARLNAIANIRRAKDFQSLAEWFASAFDMGPASLVNNGISDAARNIDSIWSLAKRMGALRAIHDDENADMDDRLEATRDFNQIVAPFSIKLDNGNSVSIRTLEAVTGVDTNNLKNPIDLKTYCDNKLSAYREEAQNVCARAGVAPQAAVRRIKAANDEVTRATGELQAKSSPITQAWHVRCTEAQAALGYDQKKEGLSNLMSFYRSKLDELAGRKPRSYDPYASDEENRAMRARYEAWSADVDKIHLERSRETDIIRKEINDILQAAATKAGDLDAELAPLREEYQRIADAQKGEIAAARAEIGKIKEHVLATSPVSKETADKWFDDMVLVNKNMQTNLKKRGYDAATLKETMTEFYRMTGGRLSRIAFETKGGGRAAAQPGTGVVYVAGTFSKSTFFHEMAHILEDDERTKATSNRFLDQRTGRDQEGKNKVSTLASLTGNRAYKSSEVAYPDSFIDPYVGKYYRDGATEVFSMGMQYFNSPEAMVTLLERDPDHFNFMLGYMATPPRLDKAKVAQQQAAMADKKDAVQTSDEFLKALDKKIAKAGDFWTSENVAIINGYRNTYFAQYDGPDRYNAGGISRHQTWSVKGEKNIKRAIWLWIAAGKPMGGEFYIDNLVNNVFNQKKIVISKQFAQDPTIQGAL